MDLPIETFPLTEIWENAVKEYPDNQVIAFMGTHITYAELDIEVTKMAAQLQKLARKKECILVYIWQIHLGM